MQRFQRIKNEDKGEQEINRMGIESLNTIITENPWVFDFNDETALIFHEKMMYAFQQDPYRPIIIYINSYGGDVSALFSMLDTMDAIRDMAPKEFAFITCATGKAMSAGAVLLSYGDIRFATQSTSIMIHQVISGIGGSHPANEREFREVDRMNDRLLGILQKRSRTKQSVKELKEKLSHNLYLTPEEAKEFGIIDAIGYPRIIENKVYDLIVAKGESGHECSGEGDCEAPKAKKQSGKVSKSNKKSGKSKGKRK